MRCSITFFISVMNNKLLLKEKRKQKKQEIIKGTILKYSRSCFKGSGKMY